MKVAFAGTSEFAVPILKTITSQTNWDVALVISEPAKASGRKNQLIASPISKLAQELNLNLLTPVSIKDIKEDILKSNLDILVVVSYGQILPKDIICLPKYKTVNIHPSLLPRLRGASPIQTALAQGLTETGVSLMLIDGKVDHGPIISQEVFLIDQSENYLTLEFKLAQIGASMFVRDLPKYVSGELQPQPQDDSQATFTKMLKKEDGLVDWSKSADDIYNQWRAYLNWPGVYTFFKDKSGRTIRLKLIEVELQSADQSIYATSDVAYRVGKVFTDESKNLYIACRKDAIKLIRVQVENSKVLTASEFLNGHGYVVSQKLE
ncbi:MAG: methionyl-tRNA formyltransferase [bacterium]|nr:methionyl-tRNA formyltransferase [bacterium]